MVCIEQLIIMGEDEVDIGGAVVYSKSDMIEGDKVG